MNGSVAFLAGVGTGNNFAGHSVREANAMNAKAVISMGQGDVTTSQIFLMGWRDDHRVVIQNIGLHALTLRAKTNAGAAFEEGLANGGELRGVAPFDGL